MSRLRMLSGVVAISVVAALSWGCSTGSTGSAKWMATLQLEGEADAEAMKALALTPADADPASTFSVTFEGIIIHAALDRSSRRAVLVSDDMGRRHLPLLSVQLPDDPQARKKVIAKLFAVTGKVPQCSAKRCRVRVDGLAMRIRGGGKPSITPYQEDRTFQCLVPHMMNEPVNGGGILPDVLKRSTTDRAHLPSPPAAGFFEIENGTLSASANEHTAAFDSDKVCRQFARSVRWEGVTDGPATLEVASDDTSWEWVPIPLTNLNIAVVNLAEDGRPDPHHFSMNAKLLANKDLPHVIDQDCKNPVDCQARAMRSRNVVPGCSDTQWP